MPIRPELRIFYRGSAWKAVRRRILERAGGEFDAKGKYLGGAKCEQCGVPDRQRTWRNGGWWLNVVTGMAHDSRGKQRCAGSEFLPLRSVRIVLTVAHLNHVAGDDRDENLKALCQWCHLHFDAEHHRETRSKRKDAARPLLASSPEEWADRFCDFVKRGMSAQQSVIEAGALPEPPAGTRG